ncbi:alpha/beta-hydrolase [Lentinus tigrinus ALCF2SS1-7]|uniref:Carboxylic ester hydrolase n=1 Tax=Lentinus tigrinus ALCF2SS1-6 TaxID=1328759 RepID=A0A5C2SCV5_9APHY|nr:alpha/beta-hydrolase [Lentinus tigrinus ALCF2SS1-6]RPD76196.1 alpha/beta-hydrolase [Lentinus tigrinus ALCF2SS1-7]
MLSTRLLPLFVACSGCLGLATAASDSAPNIVDLGYVKYRGNLTYPDTVAYLGVPYAEPPVGERRWRKPLALNTSRIASEAGGKVVNATEYADFCIQGSTGSGDAGGAGSEDCLNLDIYAPAGAKKGDKLPVLVYIHGGGYVYGNPANWPFNHWIHQSPNVVIASVYYRLDSIGFLTTPEMATQNLGDMNAGFYDQVQALTWVQQHISAFGGDPSKVTINGQSAGGSSVELHLVAHESKGLFSGAIAQSVFRTPLPSPNQQKPMFDYYAEQAGCGSGSAAVKMACLRKADVSALSRAQDSVMYNFTGPYASFHPVMDNKLFTEYPSISIMKGNFADVPVIVGSTSNETLSGGSNITEALKAYFPELTQTDLEQYLKVYPASDFDSDAQRFQVATGESDVICGRHIIGLAAARKNKAFTYRYNQPVNNATSVYHSSENWMMFMGTSTGFNGTTTFEPQTDLDHAFAEELIAYWLSFVRTGDPNTFKLDRSPVWPEYTAKGQQRIALQEPKTNDLTISGSNAEQEPALESSRCDFVASKSQRQQA